MLNYLAPYAGWFSILAAVFTILSFAALFIFFAVGGVFGPINDVLSVFQTLFLVPVALALYQVLRQEAPGLIWAVTASAIAALVAIAILQILLVFRVVHFEQTIKPILLLGVVIGVWWSVVGILMLKDPTFPGGLAWASIISGLSFVIIAVGFWLSGPQNPLAAAGFLVGAIVVPLWAFWLGRLLLSQEIIIPM